MTRLLIGVFACSISLLGCTPSATEAPSSKPASIAAPGELPKETSSEESGQKVFEPAGQSSSDDPLTLDDLMPQPLRFESFFEIPELWTRLGKEPIWIDRENHRVVVGGQICLRAGPLEMFACPLRTKEHESIVAVHTAPRFVHAALLAVGARPGTTVRFDPEYQPATGPKVKIAVRWTDEGEPHEVAAQQMVRDIATGKAMEHDWLFVGSASWTNPDTKEEYYLADSGEFICVSNFGVATMDLPVESSAEASGLLFDAFTDNIPPLGTPVLLVLEPELADTSRSSESAAPQSPPTEKPAQTDGKSGPGGEGFGPREGTYYN